MKTATGLAALLALAALTLAPPAAARADGKKESKIAVVAAENFYGDIARQIGGDRVTVVSIMNSPDQDPHLFETTPGIVRQIANAQVVVFNGANYDPWMEKLLQAAPRPGRLDVHVAAITNRKSRAAIRIFGTIPRSFVRSPARSTPISPRSTAPTTRTTARGAPLSRPRSNRSPTRSPPSAPNMPAPRSPPASRCSV